MSAGVALSQLLCRQAEDHFCPPTPNSGAHTLHVRFIDWLRALLADASKGENSAYTVELDMVENTITATSKATGEDVLLTRDPFGQSGAISSIYVDEDACYYASSGEVGDGFQIYRIDLKNFSTRLYFSTGSDNMATFWGLLDHEPTVDELLADVGSITSFVVDGNYIYYLQGGRLYKVFRWTGWETVVVPNVEGMRSLEYMSVT